MITATEREQIVKFATHVAGHDSATDRETELARGLLAEHGEVLASRIKIGDMSREAQESALRFVEAERRHVADLAAARGVTARLREAILSGGVEAAQLWAASEALSVVNDPQRYQGTTALLARAYLAQGEGLRDARAELAAVRDGIALVLAVTPRGAK